MLNWDSKHRLVDILESSMRSDKCVVLVVVVSNTILSFGSMGMF